MYRHLVNEIANLHLVIISNYWAYRQIADLALCNAMTIMGTGASLYAHILLTIMCPKTFQFML